MKKKDYYDNEKSCLFFGIYDDDDLLKIISHFGPIYILFGGDDINKIHNNK